VRRLYGSNLAAAGRGHELNDPLPVGAVLDAPARGDDLETQFTGSVDDDGLVTQLHPSPCPQAFLAGPAFDLLGVR